uniref:Uncharacterized protein n=1 Tax=Anguilla anguilla TaxID=7936 RepID=A0A0E9R1H3_ANGAN
MMTKHLLHVFINMAHILHLFVRYTSSGRLIYMSHTEHHVVLAGHESQAASG